MTLAKTTISACICALFASSALAQDQQLGTISTQTGVNENWTFTADNQSYDVHLRANENLTVNGNGKNATLGTVSNQGYLFDSQSGKLILVSNFGDLLLEKDSIPNSLWGSAVYVKGEGSAAEFRDISNLTISSNVIGLRAREGGQIKINVNDALVIEAAQQAVLAEKESQSSGVITLNVQNDLTLKSTGNFSAVEVQEGASVNAESIAGSILISSGGPETIEAADGAEKVTFEANKDLTVTTEATWGSAILSGAKETSLTTKSGSLTIAANGADGIDLTNKDGKAHFEAGSELKVTSHGVAIDSQAATTEFSSGGAMTIASTGLSNVGKSTVNLSNGEVSFVAGEDLSITAASGNALSINTNTSTFQAGKNFVVSAERGSGIEALGGDVSFNINGGLDITGSNNSPAYHNKGANSVLTLGSFTARGYYGIHNEEGSVELNSDTLDITSSFAGIQSNGETTVSAKEGNIVGDFVGIRTASTGTLNLTATDLTITSKSGTAIADQGGSTVIKADSLDIRATAGISNNGTFNLTGKALTIDANNAISNTGMVNVGTENERFETITINRNDSAVNNFAIGAMNDSTTNLYAKTIALNGNQDQRVISAVKDSTVTIDATDQISIVGQVHVAAWVKDDGTPGDTGNNILVSINETGKAQVNIVGDLITGNDPDAGYSNNKIVLNMATAGSSLDGSIYDRVAEYGQTSLEMSNGSTWNSDESSSVESLTVNDASVKVGDQLKVRTLTMAGDGDFEFDSLGDASNKVMDVETVSGEGKIGITYSAAVSDELAEGADNNNLFASISLGESGEPDSVFVNNDGAAWGDAAYYFKDVQTGVITQNIVGTNSLLTSATDLAITNALMWRSQLSNLTDRMGTLRTMPETAGAWARYNGGRLDGRGIEHDYNTIEVGFDKVISNNVMLGVSFDYTKGDTDLQAGTSDNNTYTFGLYGSYFNDSGCFLDAMLKVGRIDADYDLNNGISEKGDYMLTGTIIGIETGHRWDIQNYFIEPQVQLTYSYLRPESYTTNIRTVKFDDMKSLIARVGVMGGMKFAEDRGAAYVKASYNHDFLGDMEGTFTDGTFRRTMDDELDDNWGEVSLGASYQVTDSINTFVDVGTGFGGDIDQKWRVNLGARYVF